MIGHADVHGLDEEQRARIGALYERIDTIWDLPEDLGKVEAWDDFVADCERIGFPHLQASALFGKYTTLVKGGLAPLALDAYVRLMQVIHRHGDLIASANVARMLNSVATATTTLADDPSVPLDRIIRLIDLVEEQVRRRGVDITGVHVARATVAAARGDATETFAWIEQWRAGSSDEWRPDDIGVIQMEVPLIARFDVARASETLEQRLRLLHVDAHRFDAQHPDAQGVAKLLAMLAFFYVRQGRRAEANAIAEQLVVGVGIAELSVQAVAEYLIPVLEERPVDALVVVDHVLANLHLDESDWEASAAAARSRLLADPEGEEGRLLRALADQAALAHDRRGGTDVHRRELAEFWWAGLPESPRPDIVADPAVWGDTEERAERILAAGWLPRAEMVSADDPPIAIKDRYAALLAESMEILSVESVQDADALAERLSARAEQLRCATTRFCVPLLRGLWAGQNADIVTLVRGYRRSQQQLLRAPSAVVDSIQAIGEKLFTVTVEQAVATPAVPWEQITEVVETEARIREATGGPRSDLSLARAEIAAHLDDPESLRREVEQLQAGLQREGNLLDRVALDLEVVRLSAFRAPEFAEATARWITTVGDAEQIRAATAWVCWFGVQAGRREAADEVAAMLASADGDVTTFGPLPGWVLLEGVSGTGADLGPVIDALLEEADAGSDADLCLFAAASSALLARSPQDSRGPELRDRARRIARALDARNGSVYWSSWIRDRWFPGDTGFGAPA